MKLNITKTTILLSKPLLKKKIKGLYKKAGRNHSGQITVRHKGNGLKKKYRKIDFNRTKISTGITCSIEHDPNRKAFIAAIYDFYSCNYFYILSPKNLKIGDIVESGLTIEPKLGNSLPINKIPIGSYIHNLTLRNSKIAQITRAAGTFSKLKEKTLKYALIELSSKKYQTFLSNSFATIGSVSNELFFLSKLKKAGQSRWLNIRPTVRGVAMNPVDHPHGGGEGKKSGKKKSFWGFKLLKRKKKNYKFKKLWDDLNEKEII